MFHYTESVTDAKEHAQTKDLVHRKQKGISALVTKYNKLVDKMAHAHELGQSPPNSILPRRLNARDLFRLDVDDVVWLEDPGLGGMDEGAVPLWLGNEDVRQGILAMLEVQRCTEESERIRIEVKNACTWITEEASALKNAAELNSRKLPPIL